MTLLIRSAEIITKRAAKFALNYTNFYRDKKYIISKQDILYLRNATVNVGGPGSSVGIATDYGLDGPGI